MGNALILRSGLLAASRRMRVGVMSWFETRARKSALLTMRKSHLSIDALHPRDHGLGAQLGDDRAEMLQVVDLEVDGQFGEVRRPPGHADIVDIAVMLGD